MDQVKIGKFIAKLRNENNLTQEALGEKLGVTNEDGTLLFPEFREDEYWSRRYSNWKLGQYNETELEEFGFDKNNPPKITDQNQHKIIR